MTPWIRVPYDHDPADLSAVRMAVAEKRPAPEDDVWQPAYRDTHEGERVVQIRSVKRSRDKVWISDRDGVRAVRPR